MTVQDILHCIYCTIQLPIYAAHHPSMLPAWLCTLTYLNAFLINGHGMYLFGKLEGMISHAVLCFELFIISPRFFMQGAHDQQPRTPPLDQPRGVGRCLSLGEQCQPYGHHNFFPKQEWELAIASCTVKKWLCLEFPKNQGAGAAAPCFMGYQMGQNDLCNFFLPRVHYIRLLK